MHGSGALLGTGRLMIDWPAEDTDHVFLDRHLARAKLGGDTFDQARVRPVHVSVKVRVPRCTTQDSKDSFSISYGTIARLIDTVLERHTEAFGTLHSIADYLRVELYALETTDDLRVTYVRVEPLKRNAYGSESYEMTLREGSRYSMVVRASCIIGVYDYERDTEQPIEVQIETFGGRRSDATPATEVSASAVYNFLRASKYLTVEALAQTLVDTFQPDDNAVRVAVSKPFAVPTAEHAGIVIQRRAQPARGLTSG